MASVPGLAGFGVQGTRANPRIRIHATASIAENEDWTGAAASELAPA